VLAAVTHMRLVYLRNQKAYVAPTDSARTLQVRIRMFGSALPEKAVNQGRNGINDVIDLICRNQLLDCIADVGNKPRLSDDKDV
jgi:hypothetical protein